MTMFRKIKRSLKSKSGLTLLETMMAMFILMMATAVVAAGVPTAISAYQRVVHSANAQVLISTAMTKLRDELGTATDITLSSDNKTINYINENSSRSRIYLNEDNKIYIWEYIDNAKADVAPDADEETIMNAKMLWATENNFNRLLVSDKASNTDIDVDVKNTDLTLTYDSVSYSKVNGIIDIYNMSVEYEGNPLVKILDYKIMVLNDF